MAPCRVNSEHSGASVPSTSLARGESAVAAKWGQTPFSPRLKPHVKMGSDPISHRRHGPLQPVQDFHHGLLGNDHQHIYAEDERGHVRARRSRKRAEIPPEWTPVEPRPSDREAT